MGIESVAMKAKTAEKPALRLVGHGAKFGHKLDQAIVALMSKPTLEEAARAVGVSPNTLLRWTKEPKFNAAYREARTRVFSQSMARLQDASVSAVTTLVEIMKDKNTAVSTRVRAADIILVHAARASEGLPAHHDKTPRVRAGSDS
jgi:hypothetical protein